MEWKKTGSIVPNINAIAPLNVKTAPTIGSYGLAIGSNAKCGDGIAIGISSFVRNSNVTDGIAIGTEAEVGNPSNIVSATGSIALGKNSKSYNRYSIAIGAFSRANGDNAIAIGGSGGSGSNSTYATYNQSIALGEQSHTTREYELSIGGYKDSEGNVTRRFIANVKDPELDYDAATKNYVDTQIAANATPIATTSTLGIVKPFGDGLVLHDDGSLQAAKASADTFGVVKGSDSIAITDGVAKVNPAIFGDGLTTTDGKVSVDTGFVGEHLAGDALYYDSTDGLMVKTGAGLHIDNDTLSIDQDSLPLASASNRGTVKVGTGLEISDDGALSYTPTCETAYFTGDSISGSGVSSESEVLVTTCRYMFQGSSYRYITKVNARIKLSASFAAGTTVTCNVNLGFAEPTDDCLVKAFAKTDYRVPSYDYSYSNKLLTIKVKIVDADAIDGESVYVSVI